MRNPVVAQFLRGMWKQYFSTRCRRLRGCLIEYYPPFVQRVARKLHKRLPSHVRLDDLVAAGNFGLLTALEKFEPARGFEFETFARPVIRGAILDYLRDIDFLPRQERALVTKVSTVTEDLQHQLGRTPTRLEIQERLGVAPEVVQRLLVNLQRGSALSLSRPYVGADGSRAQRPEDLLPDESHAPAWASIEREDLKTKITKGLTRAERLIVTLYYYEGLSMKEIGLAMQLSESRISQMRTNILARLRTQLAGRELELAA